MQVEFLYVCYDFMSSASAARGPQLLSSGRNHSIVNDPSQMVRFLLVLVLVLVFPLERLAEVVFIRSRFLLLLWLFLGIQCWVRLFLQLGTSPFFTDADPTSHRVRLRRGGSASKVVLLRVFFPRVRGHSPLEVCKSPWSLSGIEGVRPSWLHGADGGVCRLLYAVHQTFSLGPCTAMVH